MYVFLRNFKGFNYQDVLDLPAPTFWALLESLADEYKQRDKEMKKRNPKKR